MPIQKPIIEELRYVNSQPDPSLRPDQTRINWAKNGESIAGATGDTTSDGVLNRAPVEIQENVLNSHNNTKAQQVTIVQLVDTVNELTGGEDANLGSRITQAEFDIKVLDTEVENLQTNVGLPSTDTSLATGLHLSSEKVIADIGVRNPLDVPNGVENNDTVRKDLYFIKRRIGNDRNYDVNGNLSPDTAPSGMKFQIEELYNRVATVNQEIGENDIDGSIKGRIFELEQNSQAGSVTQIRSELGETADAVPGRSVYLRLDDLESQNVDLAADIDTLDQSINDVDTGIKTRVDTLETNYSIVAGQAEANELTITGISNEIGSYSLDDDSDLPIKERLSAQSADIEGIWGRLGKTDNDTNTIGNRVKELEATVGDANNPVEFTAWYNIVQNRTDIEILKGELEIISPSTIQSRLSNLEAKKPHALIASETPEFISITSDYQHVSEIVDETVDLEGYTYTNGVLTRVGGDYDGSLTIAWVLYEPTGVASEITVRVCITHPDTTVEMADYTRKLRANTVTPIAISHIASLVDGSKVEVMVKSSQDEAAQVEHDSLFIRI